jgi:NAD(P)-dependent dehydrogenase (short-subunit alcohol dehydrogenase family)
MRSSARCIRLALGEISDIVDAILYLESASFVTGEILHFDGGQSAGH